MMKKICCFVLIVLLLNSCYNYKGWKKVKFPTDTDLKASIKIKDEWEFVKKNNFIYLIDTNTNKVIAEQIFEGFIDFLSDDEQKHNLLINNSIGYDFKNYSNYTYYHGSSSGAWVWKYNDGINDLCLLGFDVYYDYTTFGDYCCAFFWYDNPYSDEFYKCLESYRFAGVIKNDR